MIQKLREHVKSTHHRIKKKSTTPFQKEPLSTNTSESTSMVYRATLTTLTILLFCYLTTRTVFFNNINLFNILWCHLCNHLIGMIDRISPQMDFEDWHHLSQMYFDDWQHFLRNVWRHFCHKLYLIQFVWLPVFLQKFQNKCQI